MKSKNILYIAIFVSLLLHILFGITVESYLRFLLKKAPLTGEQEHYFEILPYTPDRGVETFKPPKDARFLGAKNIKPDVETMPKNDIINAPKVLEQIISVPKQNQEQKESLPQTEKKEISTDIKAHINEKSPSELKKTSEENKHTSKEDKLPSFERLIPKTPELIAKMPKEESINLNRGTVKEGKQLMIATKEYKYWSYLDKMKRKIELLWQYPEIARVNGLSGSLKISFAVDKNGKLKNVVLVESSGYKFFDDAAMKALRDASPFAPFPDTWDVERLNIDGTFIYEIKVIR